MHAAAAAGCAAARSRGVRELPRRATTPLALAALRSTGRCRWRKCCSCTVPTAVASRTCCRRCARPCRAARYLAAGRAALSWARACWKVPSGAAAGGASTICHAVAGDAGLGARAVPVSTTTPGRGARRGGCGAGCPLATGWRLPDLALAAGRAAALCAAAARRSPAARGAAAAGRASAGFELPDETVLYLQRRFRARHGQPVRAAGSRWTRRRCGEQRRLTVPFIRQVTRSEPGFAA